MSLWRSRIAHIGLGSIGGFFILDNCVSAIIVFPIFITSLWDAINKPNDVVIAHHVKNTIRSIRDITVKTLFTLICLPYQAYSNTQAIGVTIWRMLFTRKNLLEWESFATAGQMIAKPV